MAKEYVAIEDDHCYVDIPVYTGRGDCCNYRRQLIMTKEVFQECYKKWILDALLQKTGKWIEVDTVIQCSACKGITMWRSDYCPNCGAKMREEDG